VTDKHQMMAIQGMILRNLLDHAHNKGIIHEGMKIQRSA
jgi:hypothetical protein